VGIGPRVECVYGGGVEGEEGVEGGTPPVALGFLDIDFFDGLADEDTDGLL
jgi:hypothetical protein